MVVSDVEIPPATGARRVFALSGVFPLGVFLFLHLWTASNLLSSRESYDRALAVVNGFSLLPVIEVLFVLLPLAFHALYGLHLTFRPAPGPHAYATDRLFAAQRMSGLVALVFVALHLRHLRFATWPGGLPVEVYSTRLAADLSSTTWGVPWIALGYLVGIGASVFHVANGLAAYLRAWHRPGRRALTVIVFLGGLFFLSSSFVVLGVATGTRFGTPPPRPASSCGPTS